MVHCQAAGKVRAACSPSSLLRWQMLRKSRTERWLQEEADRMMQRQWEWEHPKMAMWCRNPCWLMAKWKHSQLLNFPQDWPWYFVKQAMGDDLFIKVTFIRNIRLSSYLGLLSKNKRGTPLLTHPDTVC